MRRMSCHDVVIKGGLKNKIAFTEAAAQERGQRPFHFSFDIFLLIPCDFSIFSRIAF